MSITTCALSGQPLKNPVVCVKTGHVYEKDLIKKHLADTGQCPLTGRDLNIDDDLVDLNVEGAALPKPLMASSTPSLIQLL